MASPNLKSQLAKVSKGTIRFGVALGVSAVVMLGFGMAVSYARKSPDATPYVAYLEPYIAALTFALLATVVEASGLRHAVMSPVGSDMPPMRPMAHLRNFGVLFVLFAATMALSQFIGAFVSKPGEEFVCGHPASVCASQKKSEYDRGMANGKAAANAAAAAAAAKPANAKPANA